VVIVILMCSLGRSLAQDIAVGTMSKKVYTTCNRVESLKNVTYLPTYQVWLRQILV